MTQCFCRAIPEQRAKSGSKRAKEEEREKERGGERERDRETPAVGKVPVGMIPNAADQIRMHRFGH